MSIVDQLKAARRVSTPLVAIRTADQAATTQAIVAGFNGEQPILWWDLVNGIVGVNEPGISAAYELKPSDGAFGPPGPERPDEALTLFAKLPEGAIALVANVQRIIDNEVVVQAIWNLRDLFKRNKRTLVLLCPSITLPPELTQDVLVLDEALPDEIELGEIVQSIYESAGRGAVDDDTHTRVVDATIGLSAFAAEQAIALSLTKESIDFDQLWNRKKQMIEQTPGLSIYRGAESFDGIIGVENAESLLRRTFEGSDPPRAIVFIDEIEKSGVSAQGDTSGTNQDALQVLLTYMQDRRTRGLLFVGVPGSGKSALAKAAGNYGRVPTIQWDMGAMKGSLVGQSEGRIRDALKVVDAVSQGRALFIATCNNISKLPPELRRRFKRGTFYFDLPDPDERTAIWQLYADRFNVHPSSEKFSDEGWTGAEIEQCCEMAGELGMSCKDAAAYIVPVAKAAAAQIDALRLEAHGRYISATYPGPYDHNRATASTASTASIASNARRALEV